MRGKHYRKGAENELYTYAYPWILNDRPGSHSVVYPENDPMVIFGRY